ncbi:MAG: Crp/Fnr family transcriptional regulator [Bdellovibrionales bacterium]|nr:Crp/Fnr family transcriptional regulator [Massilia sp.]
MHRVAANNLLGSLPAVVLERMLPHLALVQLTAGETLYDANLPQRDVYFPVGARVALSYMGNGVPAVISFVDHDGVIGIPLFLNGSVSPCRAVVSTAGTAYRISASRLTGEFNRPGPALRQFLAYARHLTEQMTQTAKCGVEEVIDKKRCEQCGYAKACPHAG